MPHWIIFFNCNSGVKRYGNAAFQQALNLKVLFLDIIGKSYFHLMPDFLLKGAGGSAVKKISISCLLSLNHHSFSN